MCPEQSAATILHVGMPSKISPPRLEAHKRLTFGEPEETQGPTIPRGLRGCRAHRFDSFRPIRFSPHESCTCCSPIAQDKPHTWRDQTDHDSTGPTFKGHG